LGEHPTADANTVKAAVEVRADTGWAMSFALGYRRWWVSGGLIPYALDSIEV